MRRAMDGGKGIVPQRPGLMDAWLKVFDALVRILTFVRGRNVFVEYLASMSVKVEISIEK